MNANLSESVKKVLEERIKSPLWGFIILAWLWFNWPNLAVLFMSDAPVKFRIDYILSQNYFYLRSTVAPVIAGGLLAIITPYAQLLLSKTHKRAEDRHRNNVFMSKSEDVKDAIKLAKLRVQSDRVVETENAKIDANIKAEVERGKREALKTEELEASKQSLLIELKNLEKSIDLHRKEKALIQDLIVKSSSIMDKFFKIDNSSSIQKLKEEIKELYADRGIEMATIRNKIRDGEELTEQQTSYESN
ncbi:hypothetical protein [Pectobacterium odoriferum]|uniref:hypothetical protein n=1 Tax=Pectobacterium odoriferum TaxID=78398 RepID=UPI00215634F5|nr:hypothetical protein [Pectobacterium odoriferum]